MQMQSDMPKGCFVAVVGPSGAGKDTIISGWKNKLQVAASGVLPQSAPAELHRGMAEPGSGKE